MRSSKSRSRSKSNRNRSMGNVVNRVFDSSGPEGKVRGTPQQIIDKYNQLARDAQLSNDRVAAENFQQHAEHYLRMLAEAQREQLERQQQQQQQHQQNQQRRQEEQQKNQDARSNAGDKAKPDSAKPDTVKSDEVIDLAENEGSGLVETPEERPQRQKRQRRKPNPSPSQEVDTPEEATNIPPDAAE